MGEERHREGMRRYTVEVMFEVRTVATSMKSSGKLMGVPL
jgi:hypothetical protein